MKLKVYPGHRPRTRGECACMPRPCPFVSCRWHLAHEALSLDLDDATMAVAIVEETGDTCALDVADRGADEYEVASLMGVSHQRVNQLVRSASKRAALSGVMAGAMEALRSLPSKEDPLQWAHGDDNPRGFKKSW